MSYGDLLSEEELRALEEIVRLPHAHSGVLLADDDEAARDALATRLIGQGIACAVASDAERALALLLERPTLGLLVAALPTQESLELVRRVRQSARPNLPAIILSADADVQDAIDALHLKVLDFLLQPVDPSVLVTLIRNEIGAPPKPPRRRGRPGEDAARESLTLISA